MNYYYKSMISNLVYIEIKKMFKKSISIRQIIPFLAILMVLNAQIMSPSLLSLRRSPQISHKSDDHSKVIFNGPSENIVLKLNIQFDPTLKHFRIQEVQQVECSGETQQEEIVTVVKTETKTVNQQKKEVKSSQGLKQNQNTLKVVSKPNVLNSNTVQTVLTGKPIVLSNPKVAQAQVTNKVVTSQTTKKTEKLEQTKPIVTIVPVKAVNLGINTKIASSSKNEVVKTQKIDEEKKVQSNLIQTKNIKSIQAKPKVENSVLTQVNEKANVIVGTNPKTWGVIKNAPIKVNKEDLQKITQIEPIKVAPLKLSEQALNENVKSLSQASKPTKVQNQESESKVAKVQNQESESKVAKVQNQESAPKAQSEGQSQASNVQNEGSQNVALPVVSKRPSKANLSSQPQPQTQTQGQASPTESSSVPSSQPTKASSWKIF